MLRVSVGETAMTVTVESSGGDRVDRVSLDDTAAMTGAVANSGGLTGSGHPGEEKLRAHLMITRSAAVEFSNGPGLSRKLAPRQPSWYSFLHKLMEHFSMLSVYWPGSHW